MVEGGDPLDTTNFSWSTRVIDEPDDAENAVAEQFVRIELMANVGQRLITDQYVTPNDVWFGPQHDGYVEREQFFLSAGQRDVLSLADPMVPDGMVEYESVIGPDDLLSFTVCGVMLNSRDHVCWPTIASNPLMAYFVVWEQMQQRTGDHMLLCAVHPGDVPSV